MVYVTPSKGKITVGKGRGKVPKSINLVRDAVILVRARKKVEIENTKDRSRIKGITYGNLGME